MRACVQRRPAKLCIFAEQLRIQVRRNPCAAASNDVGMQNETKEPQAPKPQLVETMSSQLSIFHLHMTCFSSWLNGDFVSRLADLREPASKIHSILVRRATAPDHVAAKGEACSRASADLQSAHS